MERHDEKMGMRRAKHLVKSGGDQQIKEAREIMLSFTPKSYRGRYLLAETLIMQAEDVSTFKRAEKLLECSARENEIIQSGYYNVETMCSKRPGLKEYVISSHFYCGDMGYKESEVFAHYWLNLSRSKHDWGQDLNYDCQQDRDYQYVRRKVRQYK